MTKTAQQIPAGWKVVKLGDVSLINPKINLNGIDDEKSVGFISMADVSNTAKVKNIQERSFKEVSKGFTKFQTGDILFAKITPCMENGKGGLLKNSKYSLYFGSTEFHVIRATQVVDNLFIHHLLNNEYFRKIAAGHMRGSAGQRRVPTEFLENYEFALPPLSEQTSIAAILSKVDEEIEKVERIIEQTEKLKKGLMQKLLTKGIGHTKFKQSELGEIPEEWEVVKLENICDFTTGKLNSNKAILNGKYPFFTCSQETFAIDSYSFDQEAILLAGNNAAGIYSVKYYNGKFDAYQRTYVITAQSRENLDYICLKEVLQTKLEELKNASFGSTTKFLTVKLLKNLQIKLPSLNEQRNISKILSALNSNISINQKMKSYLFKLKKGLMNDLLSGKVRVALKDVNLAFHQWLLNFPHLKESEKTAITKLFNDVKKITKQNDEEIFAGIYFNGSDHCAEKLESILAEWRSVIFLKNFYFETIKVLPGQKKKKRPDISANFNNRSFSIEVKCLTMSHSREKISGLNVYAIDDNKLGNTLCAIAPNAKVQLDAEKSDYKMLIFVFNRSPDAELHSYQENKKLIENVMKTLDWGEKYYFGFVSRNGLEDFLLPSLN